METDEILKVTHLRKAYGGRDVLKDVTFSLAPGTAAALIGPPGTGKTTLFRIIAGMAFPEEGSISIFGRSGETELRKARQQVGFLVDTPFGKKSFNAEKNLLLLAGLYGKPDKQYIRHLMKRLRIRETDVGSKRVSLLIKAEQARYALAAALVNKPRLLILDEPLEDMHTDDLEMVCTLLNELREEGTAMLLSGSSVNRLRLVCSQALLLSEGIVTGPVSMSTVSTGTILDDTQQA